jgi:hypothetical protein
VHVQRVKTVIKLNFSLLILFKVQGKHSIVSNLTKAVTILILFKGFEFEAFCVGLENPSMELKLISM